MEQQTYTPRIIPWSYTSLTSYETCPFQFASLRVHRTAKKETLEDAAAGIKNHADIENHYKTGSAIQDKKIIPIVQKTLEGLDKSLLKFEYRFAVTEAKTDTEYRSPDAYCRAIADVVYVDDSPVALIKDWKNGKKIDEYSKQLELTSLCLFARFPHVQRVDTEYVWMRHGVTTKDRVYREFSEGAWKKFDDRVKRLKLALELDAWPKKPSGLCKAHCPVTLCEFNGKRGQ